MKMKFLLLLFITYIFLPLIGTAQNITNGGFENWTGNPAYPVGWADDQSVTGGLSDCVTQDTINYVEGHSSVKLKTDTLIVSGVGAFMDEGQIYYGGGVFVTSPQPNIIFHGTAFTSRPDSIQFSYKYSPVGGDTGTYNFDLTNWSSNAQQSITQDHMVLFSTNNNWVNVSHALHYSSNQNPDTLSLNFHTSYEVQQTKGTTLWVDAIKLVYNGTSAVDELHLSTTVSLYPNPASVIIKVASTENTDGMHTEIFDINGRAVLSSTLQNNNIDVSQLAKGEYLLLLNDKYGKQLQGRFSVLK